MRAIAAKPLRTPWPTPLSDCAISGTVRDVASLRGIEMPRLPGPQLRPPVAVPASSVPRRRRRTAQPRDFQRSRLYRWEAAHVFPHDGEILRLDACVALVERAYRWAEDGLADRPGWTPPLVCDGRGRRHACGSRSEIKLPRWARTRPVVLHECAHGLTDDRHGPRFVARYVELLVAFLGLDRDRLLASLAAHRVRIAIADGLHPRRYR
jgi:hypothetical protein